MSPLSTWLHKLRIWSCPWLSLRGLFSTLVKLAITVVPNFVLVFTSTATDVIQCSSFLVSIRTTYTLTGIFALGLKSPLIYFSHNCKYDTPDRQIWSFHNPKITASITSTQDKDQNSTARYTRLSRIWPMITFPASFLPLPTSTLNLMIHHSNTAGPHTLFYASLPLWHCVCV